MPRRAKDDLNEDKLEEKIEEKQEELETMAENAGRYARRVLEETNLTESGDKLAAAIRDEPLKALLIAGFAGLILGAIIRR